MTTFTVWQFDTPGAAQQAADILRNAQGDGLVKIVDHAVVSWPAGADKPTVHHAHEDEKRGTGWGALWGLLLGALFFVPLLGAAAGAATGAMAKHFANVGIGDEQIERIRGSVVPGTSALFAVTDAADLDRLGERFHGLHQTLLATNLTEAERSTLHETFG
jgi:uncharacterized membrane protein